MYILYIYVCVRICIYIYYLHIYIIYIYIIYPFETWAKVKCRRVVISLQTNVITSWKTNMRSQCLANVSKEHVQKMSLESVAQSDVVTIGKSMGSAEQATGWGRNTWPATVWSRNSSPYPVGWHSENTGSRQATVFHVNLFRITFLINPNVSKCPNVTMIL